MAGVPPHDSPKEGKKTNRKYYTRDEFCVVRESGREDLDVKCQLERALEKGYQLVIVDPPWLGDQALRWIRFGNFLHKTAVIFCLSGLVCAVVPQRLFSYVPLPLGTVGVCCVALYDMSWQFDPCSKYQVDQKGCELTHVPSHELHSPSPVVLVFRNDIYRKRLHNILALATIAIVGWKVYRSLYS